MTTDTLTREELDQYERLLKTELGHHAETNGVCFPERKLRQIFDAARQGLDAGWRTDFENAPKEGRHFVLMLTPSRFPQVARPNMWWTTGFSVENKPTHFMLIPDLPSPPEGA